MSKVVLIALIATTLSDTVLCKTTSVPSTYDNEGISVFDEITKSSNTAVQSSSLRVIPTHQANPLTSQSPPVPSFSHDSVKHSAPLASTTSTLKPPTENQITIPAPKSRQPIASSPRTTPTPTPPPIPSAATMTAKPSSDTAELKKIVLILILIMALVMGILVLLTVRTVLHHPRRFRSHNSQVYQELKTMPK